MWAQMPSPAFAPARRGTGFDTAAIALPLPACADSLGLKVWLLRRWPLNPIPALTARRGRLVPVVTLDWMHAPFGAYLAGDARRAD